MILAWMVLSSFSFCNYYMLLDIHGPHFYCLQMQMRNHCFYQARTQASLLALQCSWHQRFSDAIITLSTLAIIASSPSLVTSETSHSLDEHSICHHGLWIPCSTWQARSLLTSSTLFAVNEAVQNWILGYDVACKGKGMWTWGMVS